VNVLNTTRWGTTQKITCNFAVFQYSLSLIQHTFHICEPVLCALQKVLWFSFDLARLFYVRLETFGSYYVTFKCIQIET
jgi:hypothetical protein